MIGHKILNRIALLAITAVVGTGVYFNAPPPRQAHATFTEGSSWGSTAGGSANALVIGIDNVQSLNDLLGVTIRFKVASDNAPGPVTVAVGGQTATSLKRPTSIGLQDPGSELQAGVSASIMFTGTVFEIVSPVDMTPIGSTCEFRGSGAPRGCVIEDGSCISQANYAALFTVVGTSYGSCSAGLFKLPFSNGTGFIAYDAQGVNGAASRITTASCANPNAPTLCGLEKNSLTIAQLPTGNIGTTSFDFGLIGNGATGSSQAMVTGITNSGGGTVLNLTIASAGSGNPLAFLNPVIPGIRAIKF